MDELEGNERRGRQVNELAFLEEDERRGRDVNWFVGFEGNERRGRQVNELAVLEEDERRGRDVNWFVGFEGNERRGRQLNWFEGFEVRIGGEMNEEMNGRMQEIEEANEGARGDEWVADGGMRVGVNVEGEGARGGGNIRGGAGRARERGYIGRRSRCRLCGRTVSYANMARHERTHRVWDPGGGPYPA